MGAEKSISPKKIHVAPKTTRQSIFGKAADRPNKNLLLTEIDTAFRKFRRNKKAWKQELDERREWGGI